MHSALRGEVRGILTTLERGHPGTMRGVVEGQARLSQHLLSIPRATRLPRACERCGDPSTARFCQACRLFDPAGGSGTSINLER